MSNPKSGVSNRAAAFAVLFVVCAAGAAIYFRVARQRVMPQQPSIPLESPARRAVVAAPGNTSQPVRRTRTRRLLYCSISPDAHSGHLATVALDGPDKDKIHFYDDLACMRADFRGGRGICLHVNLHTFSNPNEALLFDQHFHVHHVVPLDGVLSRARVSPDGKWGAVTVFTVGESYASGVMSTKTTLIDMHTGTVVLNLEDMVVRNKGVPFKEQDFNFWGVTFTKDSRSFYATLATGGKIYLIKGIIASRDADIVGEGVECPSLSPDNTRIAFKKRSPDGRATWHLAVLNLKTMRETVLPEPASIDQQVQWYDNNHVLYSLPEKILGKPIVTYAWIIAADGKSPPQKFFPNADSPLIYDASE